MDQIKPVRYLNPITFEAELFVNNLENLSKIYNQCDIVLINALEKVMAAIENFLGSNPNEILATEKTKLVTCDDIKHIKRIYTCTRCKTDLGKSVEKATLHIAEGCAQHGIGGAYGSGGKRQISEKNLAKPASEQDKRSRDCKKVRNEEQRVEETVKLTKKTRSLLVDFNQFFVDHVKICKKLKHLQEYCEIENDLITLIKPLFPNQNVKIYKFGSRVAGIGRRESDLDLFIDIGDTFHKFQNRADKDTLDKFRKVAEALSKNRKLWKGLVQIKKARVPILKIIHSPTSIECDINFSNSLGTVNTSFIEYIFSLQPIAHLLCIFMKKWLNRTGLDNEINTYSIILMVIFYLQVSKVVPSMEELQLSVNSQTPLTVGPWLCSYAELTLNDLKIKLEEMTQLNLLKSMKGFFEFYIHYNYEEEVICPYLGTIIKKNDFEKRMPERYSTYVVKSEEYVLQLDKPIVVQDPIQLNHNVTKALSTLYLKIFKTFMVKSLYVLNEAFPK